MSCTAQHCPAVVPADYSRLNNINALVLSLWPSLSEAIKNEIVLQMVPGMMDQVVKDYGAGYLTHLKLLEFELGKVSTAHQYMLVFRVDGDLFADHHKWLQ